jgi:hypothetical protein
MNREQWLTDAAELLRPIFKQHGYDVPHIRVSTGWPSKGGRSLKRRTIGECWFEHTSVDGIPQLFISPVLVDGVEVLATLAHEMAHVVAGVEAMHRGKFMEVINAIGLIGKPTATKAGPELEVGLLYLLKKLGDYPHAKLIFETKPKQSTRLIKASCSNCECIIRITRSWIEQAEKQNGGLSCPVCLAEFMTVEGS